MDTAACPATKRFNGPPYSWTLSQKSLKIKYVHIYVSNLCVRIFKWFLAQNAKIRTKYWASQFILQQKDSMVLLIYEVWAKNHLELSRYVQIILVQIYLSNVYIHILKWFLAQNAQLRKKIGTAACPATKRFNGPPKLWTLSQKSL